MSSYIRIPQDPSSLNEEQTEINEEPNQTIANERPSTEENQEPIVDPDDLFERLYSYYCGKGLRCITIKWITELLCIGFTIWCLGFLLLRVNWDRLRNAECGMNAARIMPCDLATFLHQHPLTPLTLTKAIIVGYLGIFSTYWIICFLLFFAQLMKIMEIQKIYKSLGITDSDFQIMPWDAVLEKIAVRRQLSAHNIVIRLMRKENYLIGLVNKKMLAFPISKWIPCAGPAISSPDATQSRRLILSVMLEWILKWCILSRMFNRNFRVRKDFLSDPRTLKKRLMVVGFAMLLLSPLLAICMLVYLFLRHAEQFYNHPSMALSRRWSNLSRWIFREFNEVDHLFKHRIDGSVLPACEYHKKFPFPIISTIAKSVSFVSGGFTAILIIIALLEKSLLEVQIFGHTLLWFASFFGAITTTINMTGITKERLILDADGAMSRVVQHTHYMPKKWRGKEGTEMVRIEFATLFPYVGMILLEELASIFVTPYLLIFVIPKRLDDILQFIQNFTEYIPGVGDVCSFSTFNFAKHGNQRYGSPHNASDSRERTSQGKMEKSALSFRDCYPSLPVDEVGQLVENLKPFREKKLAGYGGLPSDHRPYILDWYYARGDVPSPSSQVTLTQ